MENFAVHVEGLTDDLDAVTRAAERFAKATGAKSAFLSTPEGTHDLTKETLVEAETEDGTKVKVKAPDRFVPFPKSFDPMPHQDLEGNWQIEDAKEPRKYHRLSDDEVKAMGQEPKKAKRAPRRRRRKGQGAAVIGGEVQK